MEKAIMELLSEEIKKEIRDISELQVGSEEKSKAIEDLAKLYKMRIDETENQRDKNRLAEQVKDRYFKFGVDAAGIILPMIFYAVWLNKGFKFEETGTFTSTTFRGLFSRFRPTNKI
ncbi:hypothetical protein AGMMS49975_12350 [Clostridia bacterium]|nr:hypothetical protein AGMMS49975_12350 [Clostridia bacterium]